QVGTEDVGQVQGASGAEEGGGPGERCVEAAVEGGEDLAVAQDAGEPGVHAPGLVPDRRRDDLVGLRVGEQAEQVDRVAADVEQTPTTQPGVQSDVAAAPLEAEVQACLDSDEVPEGALGEQVPCGGQLRVVPVHERLGEHDARLPGGPVHGV